MSTVAEGLAYLAKTCKASVNVEINDHTTNYERVESYIAWYKIKDDEFADVVIDYDEMVANQTVVKVQYYTDTPIGFYFKFAPDVPRAVEAAVRHLKSLSPDRSEKTTRAGGEE